MSFRQAGPVTVVIDDVFPAEPKFAKGADDFDICIHIVNVEDEAQSDYWRGEISQDYGKGNFKDMTQAQITMKTLRSIGFEGDDLTQLKAQLMGKKIPAMIKESAKDGKTYYNVHYIGGSGEQPVAIDAEVMKKRIAALFGGAAPEPKAAPAAATPPPATTPPPAAAKPGPFGKAAPAKSPFGK
jgi:hypothetical protein